MHGLQDSNDVWQMDSDVMESIVVEYFQNLFLSSSPTTINEVIQLVDERITPEMNAALLSPFSSEEVRSALFQISPSKAPGPDGITALFFQKYWNIVGLHVTDAVLDCLNSGRLLKSVNFTNIVLIPKIKALVNMSHFRPISLCNVLYKIISKVLVNRMKNILPAVISDCQSAFVPGRMISDNIIISFEMLHYLKNKRGGKVGQMVAKLDMSKTYDRVEWDYLRAIFLKLGFHKRWVSLIMMCVSSVTYSVMVNGEQKGFIKPGRELCQGDPLSPYLFLICAEGLSALLRKAERDNLIHGISICRGGPRVSHLFFADNSIIFCNATTLKCQALLHLLSIYESASGQKVNGSKTAIFFSHNTTQASRDIILYLFGTTTTTQFEKYLGLPPVIGRAKKRVFNDLKDSVGRRLQGWKEKLLSQAGKEILIKAVIQAMPTYVISCFKLPLGLCSEISSMAMKFWWGQRGMERKVHWLSKKKLTQAKNRGGMGFRELSLFNSAILAKQGWRLVQSPNSLVSRVLKAKYYPNQSFLEASIKGNPSLIWRSICGAKQVLIDGLIWRVGTGENIKIWKDSWLIGSPCSKILSAPWVLEANAMVSELINHEQGCWNSELIDQIFLPTDAVAIKQIH